MKHVLYIGWIGYNNLGDELMFECFKEHFNKLGDNYKLDLVNNEKRYLDNANLAAYDLIVLGGGSILSGAMQPIQPHIIDTLYQALQMKKKVMIWGSGIDWVPKEYLAVDARKNLITDHLSDSLRQKLNTVFDQSVWTGVRGPLSKQVLQDAGVTKNIKISGDPAFLLPNKINTDLVLETTDSKDKIIGVNWGTSFHRIYGKDEFALEDKFAAALNQLIDKGFIIYFYLMWDADLEPTKRLAAKLHDTTAFMVDENIYPAITLISFMQNFTFTLNFKLHANYISLMAGVPFIALGYRFKIFDFAHSVDLEDMVIATDDPDIDSKIISLEKKISSERPNIVDTMRKQQELYRLQLLEPFENGLYI